MVVTSEALQLQQSLLAGSQERYPACKKSRTRKKGFSLDYLGRSGLTWSERRKSKPVKQSRKYGRNIVDFRSCLELPAFFTENFLSG